MVGTQQTVDRSLTSLSGCDGRSDQQFKLIAAAAPPKPFCHEHALSHCMTLSLLIEASVLKATRAATKSKTQRVQNSERRYSGRVFLRASR